jgi:hypothetical protein
VLNKCYKSALLCLPLNTVEQQYHQNIRMLTLVSIEKIKKEEWAFTNIQIACSATKSSVFYEKSAHLILKPLLKLHYIL